MSKPVSERKNVEAFMSEKGLAYVAEKGYEAHQVYSAIGAAGRYQSVVVARIRGDKDYFAWGFYPADEAMDVAKRVKRGRKFWVMDVTVVPSAERIG